MNKILSYICLLIFTFSISANSKGNIVDRKKNFDSKAKFLFSMQEIITSEKLNKDLQGLKDMANEVDTTYRSGEKEKIKKTLSVGEMKLATSMKDYTTFISAETKELMEAYSSQVTNAEEKESDKKSKRHTGREAHDPERQGRHRDRRRPRHGASRLSRRSA